MKNKKKIVLIISGLIVLLISILTWFSLLLNNKTSLKSDINVNNNKVKQKKETIEENINLFLKQSKELNKEETNLISDIKKRLKNIKEKKEKIKQIEKEINNNLSKDNIVIKKYNNSNIIKKLDDLLWSTTNNTNNKDININNNKILEKKENIPNKDINKNNVTTEKIIEY